MRMEKNTQKSIRLCLNCFICAKLTNLSCAFSSTVEGQRICAGPPYNFHSNQSVSRSFSLCVRHTLTQHSIELPNFQFCRILPLQCILHSTQYTHKRTFPSLSLSRSKRAHRRSGTRRNGFEGHNNNNGQLIPQINCQQSKSNVMQHDNIKRDAERVRESKRDSE